MPHPKYLENTTNPASLEPKQRLQYLTEFGKAVEIDVTIPPKRYYRSGVEMVRMAKVYMEEVQLENAFILFHKFITLFLEKLPNHPEYRNSPPAEKKATNQRLMEVFPLAEEIKKKLLKQYGTEHDEWLTLVEKQRKEEELKEQEKAAKEKELQYLQERQISGEDLQKEIGKLQNDLWNMLPKAADNSQINYISNKLDGTHLPAEELYPTDYLEKEGQTNNIPQPSVPPRSSKPLTIKASEMLTLPLPQVDRSTKPNSLLSPSQFPDESKLLREVTVPQMLMSRFLILAQSNTTKNIETCGILAGKLAQNKFRVTHLLIPKQTGTSDSCSTDNEEELFTYQDQNDLITLGWIHTHPSQTAFMSSVDLHTHCSYQLMMPEAIAIVCAPKYQETGIYSLTYGYGVNFISSCREPGFHPHPKEPPLYETSSHVVIETDSPVQVVDLRYK